MNTNTTTTNNLYFIEGSESNLDMVDIIVTISKAFVAVLILLCIMLCIIYKDLVKEYTNKSRINHIDPTISEQMTLHTKVNSISSSQ